MNKKLITLAVGAALSAGTMVAQAADEDMMPTVYGKIHASFGTVSDKYDISGEPTYTDKDNFQLRSHASRLGVKGSIPVNDSLKATYQLEYEVNPDSDNKGTVNTKTKTTINESDVGDINGDGDTNDSFTFDGTGSGTGNGTAGLKRRNQYVGLKGGFGEVRFGRHDTPTKVYQGKFDEFNDTDADISGAIKISRGELRIDNVLAYLSPDYSGFSFAAAIAPGEGNGCKAADKNKPNYTCTDNKSSTFGGDGPADVISIAGGYKMQGLFVSLGFDKYDDNASGSTINYDDNPYSTLDGLKPGGDYKDLMRLVATYGDKMFQVGALYETSSGNKDNFQDDKDVMGISGHFNIDNKQKVKLQYMSGKQDLSVAGDNNNKVKVGDDKETQISLGYDIKMGKSTTGYAMYTSAKDKLSFDNGGGSVERKYQFIGVGLIQNF